MIKFRFLAPFGGIIKFDFWRQAPNIYFSIATLTLAAVRDTTPVIYELDHFLHHHQNESSSSSISLDAACARFRYSWIQIV